MFEIVLEDGSSLLVSPEHKVYGAVVNPNSSSSFNSEVDTTGTLFSTISLNSGSLDQILTSRPDDLYLKANAVYGKSSRGGEFLSFFKKFRIFLFRNWFNFLKRQKQCVPQFAYIQLRISEY